MKTITSPDELATRRFYLAWIKDEAKVEYAGSTSAIVWFHSLGPHTQATSWSPRGGFHLYGFDNPTSWIWSCNVQEISQLQAQALIDLDYYKGWVKNLDEFVKLF